MDATADMIAEMVDVQFEFIRRLGPDGEDYVATPSTDFLERNIQSVAGPVGDALAARAREQQALHDPIRAIFGAPLSPLQREDDLFMTLQLLASAAQDLGLDHELLGGGLVRLGDRQLLIGTAPIRRFNAFVTRARGGDGTVLVLDDEIGIALAKLARGFAARVVWRGGDVTFVDDEAAVANGVSQPHFEMIGSVLLGMLYDGHAREGVVLEVPADYDETAAAISRLAMLFVLLHELAHVQLGHVDDPEAVMAALPQSDLVEWAIDHRRELDADREALAMIGAFTGRWPKRLCGFGLALPLALFAALDALILYARAPDPETADTARLSYQTETHPSPTQRIAGLRAALQAVGEADVLAGMDFAVLSLLTAAQRCARMVRQSGQFDDLAIHRRWARMVKALGVAA